MYLCNMGLRFLVLASVSVLAWAGDVEFLTTDLPWAAVGRGYSPPPLEVRVAGKCPSGGVGYSVVSGILPAGVLLSASGHFSGVPLRKATSHFTVRAFNGCSWTARLFSLVVEDPPTIAIAPGVVRLVWRAADPAPSA